MLGSAPTTFPTSAPLRKKRKVGIALIPTSAAISCDGKGWVNQLPVIRNACLPDPSSDASPRPAQTDPPRNVGGRLTHLLDVNVDLVERKSGERIGELLKDGGDDLAARGQRELVSAWSLGARSGRRGRDVPGSAPRRPEVDDRGLVGCRGRVSMPGSCGIAVWA